jgi:transposase InsO family protein
VGNGAIKRLDEALNQSVRIEGHDLAPSCSVGVSVFPQDGADGLSLLKQADVAMYAQKNAGRASRRVSPRVRHALAGRIACRASAPAFQWDRRLVSGGRLRSRSKSRVFEPFHERATRAALRWHELVCDNGPELTSKAMFLWSQGRGVKLHFIQPGKPMQNAFVESLNGKFREYCLDLNWFASLEDARLRIERWRAHYCHRKPPAVFAASVA